LAALVLMFIKTKKAGDRMGQFKRIAGEKIPDTPRFG
jgi:hypothetical protein